MLVLCQRYAAHLGPDQKDVLRSVLRKHTQIAPKVRRDPTAVAAGTE
jgi:hypothetical protein